MNIVNEYCKNIFVRNKSKYNFEEQHDHIYDKKK